MNFSTFYILLNILNSIKINAETYVPLKEQFDVDVLSNFAQEFTKDYKKKYQYIKQQNESHGLKFKKLKYIQFIDLSVLDTSKTEQLNEFLAVKIYQNLDKINLMTIPEFRYAFEGSIEILKYNSNNQVDPIETMLGSTSCRLEKITNTKSGLTMPVCSWHWIITNREDKYPHKRALAKCNCVNCQAKTIYDSDRRRLSGCSPNVVLMPVLYRDNFKSNNSTERWWFALEEVPTSCLCSLRLKPIK